MYILKTLLEQRAKLAKDAESILTLATKENREMTQEEEDKFNKFHEEITAISKRVTIAKRQAELELETAERIETEERSGFERPAAEIQNRIFSQWLTGGMRALGTEEQAALTAAKASLPPEMRALSTMNDSIVGLLIAPNFMTGIESALKAYGGVREVSTIINTESGAVLPFPTDNETTAVGAIIAENAIYTESEPSIGAINMYAWTYHSKFVRCSYAILNDAAFDVEGWLASKLGERIARITNQHFTTGTGSGQPKGIVDASSLGHTTASATAITYGELVELMHSVDPAYRKNARWMFNDTTLKLIRKLTDGSNRPLWQPGLTSSFATDVPDTILGKPYVINQDMAGPTSTSKSMLFGDFSKYYIRDVRLSPSGSMPNKIGGLNMMLLRLVERYAEYGQIAFIGYSRHDGQLIDAGTKPVKHLAQAA